MKTLGRILIPALLVSVSAMPVRAMSADSSGYAIVLPFVASAAAFGTQTKVYVENHSAKTVELLAYYVGESSSANPGLLTCSESNQTPAPQTFTLVVPADGVLQFDLRALLEQKCGGSVPAGGIGDRGALTILANKGDEATRISAMARVERIPGGGAIPLGFSEPGLPLGALEGSTQTITGAQNGVIGAAKLRTDCLISSFYDASRSGNLYRVTVKDSTGTPLGSTVVSLAPWSAELLVDVFSLIGLGGMSIDGAMVEVEPAANATNPSMAAACRVIELTQGTTTYLMGKVYEPKDLLRQRSVSVTETPGSGKFVFDARSGVRSRHVVFLRHPDLVTCTVDSPQLAIDVTAPDGTGVTGGFQSTGEFFTRQRGDINHGVAGAWILEVTANARNPPSGPIFYGLTCVSGNGMSQLDWLAP